MGGDETFTKLVKNSFKTIKSETIRNETAA